MHAFRAPLTLVLSASFALVAAAATLHSSTQVSNENSVGAENKLILPGNSNLNQNNSNVASISTPVPVGNGINLNINYLGRTIPINKLDDYFFWANEDVRPLLDDFAEEPINHGRWQFGETSDVEFIVAAYTGKEVTYSQLATVLAGLRKYMIESKPQHSQNLDFDVLSDGQGKIGHGLVWHDFSVPGDIAKRVEHPSIRHSTVSNFRH